MGPDDGHGDARDRPDDGPGPDDDAPGEHADADGPPPIPDAARDPAPALPPWGPDHDAPDPPRRRPSVPALVAIVLAASVVTSATAVGLFRTGQFLAPGPPPLVTERVEVDPTVLDERRTELGCEALVRRAPLEDRTHLDDDEAAELGPDDLYPTRPPHSGRHLGRWLPSPTAAFDAPIDERAMVHNLEHGAVAVLYDPAALSDDEVAALEAWTAYRIANGFGRTGERVGAGILVAPAEPGSITSGAAVAMRAWGVAVDCGGFDEVVADGFLAEHFGSRGIAPERDLAPYPDGAVEVVRPDA